MPRFQVYSLPGLEALMQVDLATCLGRPWRWGPGTEAGAGAGRLTASTPQGELILLGPGNEVSTQHWAEAVRVLMTMGAIPVNLGWII